MGQIGKYTIKVSSTTYKKKLKNENKNYEYGSVSIKRPELAEYIGQDVEVRVFHIDKKGGVKK